MTGFHLPDELLGVDAISFDTHPCSTEALEACEVCALPYDELATLAQKIPALQHQLFCMMSRELVDDKRLLVMLGRMSAGGGATPASWASRRATRVSGRMTGCTVSACRGRTWGLPGLALETVSRLFLRFQDDGLIEVRGRSVQLLDPQRLRTLAIGGSESRHRCCA